MDYPHIKEREKDLFLFLLDSHVSSIVWNMLKNVLEMLRKNVYIKKGVDPHLKLKPTGTTFVIMILFFKSLNG